MKHFKTLHVFRLCFSLLLIWLCGSFFCDAPLCAQTIDGREQASPTLSADWQGMVSWIENQRQEHKIPGLAVAVVKNEEVLFIQTFGHTDNHKTIKVGRDTVFPIGSCTKPFTSLLVAMLVTDGTIHWDDPVTRYLPYFKLNIKSDHENDQVTFLDLLSHRTGFFTMELIQKAVNWAQDPDFDSSSASERITRESKSITTAISAWLLQPRLRQRQRALTGTHS